MLLPLFRNYTNSLFYLLRSHQIINLLKILKETDLNKHYAFFWILFAICIIIKCIQQIRMLTLCDNTLVNKILFKPTKVRINLPLSILIMSKLPFWMPTLH